MINLFALLIHQTQTPSAECPKGHRFALQAQHRHPGSNRTGDMQEGHLTTQEGPEGFLQEEASQTTQRASLGCTPGRAHSGKHKAACVPGPGAGGSINLGNPLQWMWGWSGRGSRGEAGETTVPESLLSRVRSLPGEATGRGLR